MNISDHILLWDQAFIRVIDVRRANMRRGEQLRSYRLPASAFICITGGSAQVRMNGTANQVDRFHILHGGKGLYVDIEAEDVLDYYLILYKAHLPLPSRQELQVTMMEHDSPFDRHYGFVPLHPSALFDKVESIDLAWRQTTALKKLQVKALFYQFGYELLEQMSHQEAAPAKPDLVGQVTRYIHENYKEPLTLEYLVSRFDCNARQFLRMFKRQTGTSPIDYVIQVRMTKAKELLVNTDLMLKEIAEKVGYADSYYFSRVFKKFAGMSPLKFRETALLQSSGRNNPSDMAKYPIVAAKLRRYIDYDNHYRYNEEGELSMHGSPKAPLAATLLFCFVLLLSACTSGPANPNAGNGSAVAGSTVTSPASSAPTAQAEQSRVVKHAMGEETLTGTPKRVVILTNEGTEALLAMGVKPVGAVQSWIGNPWYDHIKNEMQDVTVIGNEMQPNMELIVNLKPDLIIGNKARHEKIYEHLKGIAPTIFSEDLGGDWKDNLKLYSEAVNMKAEGDKAIADFDKRVAEIKDKLGDKLATQVSVGRFSANQVRTYQKLSFSGVILNELGFARPASQDKEADIEVMTKETMGKMDGDVLFYFVTEAAGKTDAAKVVEGWMNDPLFKSLNVSKTGKVVQVDEAIWNSAGGIKAANLLLDEIAKYFEVK